MTGRGRSVRVEDIHRWGPTWSRRVGWFLDHVYWNTHVTGAEHVPGSGPAIIAANHTGVVDGPVVHGAVPRGSHFIVKQEFFDSPIGFLMTWAGQIPVDRTSGRAALAVAQQLLGEGRVVGIFPEGARGRGDLSAVKAGVAWLAVQTGAPVIPTACLGTRRTGDTIGHVPRPRADLHVVFGRPLDLRPEPGSSRRAAVAHAMEVIGQGMVEHVADAVARTGVELPADDGLLPGSQEAPGTGE